MKKRIIFCHVILAALLVLTSCGKRNDITGVRRVLRNSLCLLTAFMALTMLCCCGRDSRIVGLWTDNDSHYSSSGKILIRSGMVERFGADGSYELSINVDLSKVDKSQKINEASFVGHWENDGDNAIRIYCDSAGILGVMTANPDREKYSVYKILSVDDHCLIYMSDGERFTRYRIK